MAKKKAATATAAGDAKSTDAPAAAATQKQKTAAKEPAADKAAPSAKKRAKDEIDDIFAGAKKKKESAAAEGTTGTAAKLDPELQKLADEVGDARKKAEAAGKRPKVEGSKDDIFGESSGKSRKRTEEGYVIYGEDELGLNKKGGDTPLCPFDCDCCY